LYKSCGDPYYFVYPRNRLRNPAFRRFRAWLLEQAQTAGRSSLDAPAPQPS
jgi:DNA-binding transcriptional LysR family regulator